jgi:hypothetical protein
MTPLPIKRSGTPGSLCQAQDFSLRYLKKNENAPSEASANGGKHSPSFPLSTRNLLPYSRRPPVQSEKTDILGHELLKPVAAML